MADLASIKVAVDSREVKTASADLNQMGGAAANAEGALGRFGSKVGIATSAQRELNTAIKSSNQTFSASARYVEQLATETKRLGMSAIEFKKLEIAAAAAAAPTQALRQQIREAGAEYLRAARAAQGFAGAGGGVGASAGMQRAGMQQLSFQIGDVAQQFALGTNPMMIFAQQGSQVVQALSMMQGGASGLIGFLAGPWGTVMMGAVMILGSFYANSKKAEEGTLDLAGALDFQKMTTNELTDAVNQLDAAQRKANRTSYETEQRAFANANAALKAAAATRQQAEAELQLAMARLKKEAPLGKAGTDLQAAYGIDVQNIKRQIEELKGAEEKARDLVKNAGIPIARREAAAATDYSAAATLRYDKAELGLRQRLDAGKITLDQYRQSLIGITKARDNEIEAAQKLERAQGKKPKISEYQRQQTAIREMIADMETELALIKAGTVAEQAKMRVQLARQGASAEQITKITDLTAQLAAEEKKREEAKKREDYANQIADLNTIIALTAQGVTLEEAKTRVQLARQGATKTEIDQIIQLNAQLDNSKKIADETKKIFDDLNSITFDINFDALFGNFGKALGGILSSMDGFLAKQDDINKALEKAKVGSAEWNMAQSKSIRNQINMFGNLAGNMKGFFKEGSKGYKALQAAETAFRAMEMAMALKSMAIKLGIIGTTTAASVAGSATEAAANAASETTKTGVTLAQSAVRTSAKVSEGAASMFASLGPLGFVAVAAMVAVMESFGFRGGGSSSKPVYNEGKGTVLGDPNAQSKSIANALSTLNDINDQTMRYSAQMAVSLRNIESSMAGVASVLVRSTAFQNAGANIQEGFKPNLIGKTLGSAIGGAAIGAGAAAGLMSAFGTFTALGSLGGPIGLALGAIIGGVLAPVIKSLFGTKTKIVGQGIYGASQSLGDILSGGFDAQYFTDIQKKKKFFGFTTSTSYSTQYSAADAEINRQFTMIFEGLNTSLLAAAGALGLSTDSIASKLNSFVVNIGKIDTKGKTGEQIQEAISAAIGAAADQMAAAAFPELIKFQKVGEGFFETVVRVATTVEQFRTVMEGLGNTTNVAIESVMALTDAFGGISELTSAVATYFDGFYTDAEKLALYTKQLTAVFDSLGYAVPASAEEFKALVDSLDLNTEAGQAAFYALMQVAPIYLEIANLQQQVADNQLSLVDDVRSAYQAQKDDLQSTIDKFQQFSDSLRKFRDTLYSTSNSATGYRQALVDLIRIGSLAATGDASALEQLQGVSQTFLSASKSQATSLFQYQKDVALVASYVDQGIAAADSQVSAAQKQIDLMTQTVGQLIDLNEKAQTLEEAIAALLASGYTPPASLSQGTPSDSVTSEQFSDWSSRFNDFLYQITKNTGKTTSILDTWDGDGQPDTRETANAYY